MINAISTHPVGSWCNLNSIAEVKDLEKGMDFRLPNIAEKYSCDSMNFIFFIEVILVAYILCFRGFKRNSI